MAKSHQYTTLASLSPSHGTACIPPIGRADGPAASARPLAQTDGVVIHHKK